MPRVLPCDHILCHGCIMRATVEEQFRCPYCADGSATVHAPLASKFPPHKGLRCHLSGQGEDLPMCEDCPEEQPHPATVHCPDCKHSRCDQCDKAVHSAKTMQRHARVPLDQAVPLTMCPDHKQPVVALCEADGALLCASCQMHPGAPHKGHNSTAVEHSATLLEQHLGTLLEGLMVRCRDMATAAVEWKGQAAVAEFLIEMQCALVEAEAEKTKVLVDSATALACRQMRCSVANLKAEQLCGLGHLSVASAAATVLAGKASKALQTKPGTKRTGDLVSCLSAVRLAKADALALESQLQPATSIILLHYNAASSSVDQLRVPLCPCDWSGKGTIISGGHRHCVALKGDGSIVCWGSDECQQCSGAPAGTDFVSVSGATAGSWSVALRSDGSLHSWGGDSKGQCSSTPSGTGFVAVSAGAKFGVAIRSGDGTLIAWGDDSHRQISDLPSGSGFVEVSAGHSFGGVPLQLIVCSATVVCRASTIPTVARKADGSLVAWGRDEDMEVTSTPSGTGYTSVAAGSAHAVAIRGDGSLVSWGNDYHKQCTGTPPGTIFKQVAAGRGHSLALKQDSSLVSWGSDGQNQVSGTPTGTGFRCVSGDHCSIALRDDGSLVSWGSDEDRQ
eukprot:gene12896-biopygen4244